jgi:hypothetical protein
MPSAPPLRGALLLLHQRNPRERRFGFEQSGVGEAKRGGGVERMARALRAHCQGEWGVLKYGVVSTEPDAPCNKEGEGPKQFCGWVKEIFSFTVYMKSFFFFFLMMIIFIIFF